MWHCSFKFPFDYYVVVNEEGKEIRSATDKDDLEPLKKGQKIKYKGSVRTLDEDMPLNEAVRQSEVDLLADGELSHLKRVADSNPRRHQITTAQADRVKWLLENHFIRADEHPVANAIWQVARGATHVFNLIQFSTTLTQTSDFGLTAFTEGGRVAAKIAAARGGVTYRKIMSKLWDQNIFFFLNYCK